MHKLIFLFGLRKNLLFCCLIFLCLVVAFQYRNRGYWLYPPVASTFDEFAYGWLGMSLIENGIPTSWSFIPDYANGIPQNSQMYFHGNIVSVNSIIPTKDNFVNFPKPIRHIQEIEVDKYKSQFPIVQPYLEQPPLGGILISLPLIFGGKTSFEQASLFDLRKPFVYLGVLTTFLVILLANQWYGRSVALVSGLLYATVPTIILGSRLALPENILAPLLLLEILLLEAYICKKQKGILLAALVLAFISPLVKPFGLSLGLVGIAYFVLKEKDIKKALLFIITPAMSMGAYVLYGMSFDKNTFLGVLSYQSNRFFAGPNILLYKILIPKVTKLFLDGWIFFGWLSVAVLSFKKSKHLSLLLGLFSYLLTITFFGGEDFGWYRLPLYPFLMIATGVLVVEIIKRAEFFSTLIFLGTAVASSFAWGLGVYDWSEHLISFRLFLLGAICVLLLPLVFRNKFMYLSKLLLLLLFILTLYLNTRAINNIDMIWPLLGDETSLIIGRE